MRKTITVISLMFLGLCSLAAQTLPILNVPLDAKSLAVGSTMSPTTAAFALEDKTLDAGFTYGSWMPSVNKTGMIGVDAMAHFWKIAVGVSGNFYTDQPYDINNEQGTNKGTFTPKESMINLGLAYAIIPSLSVGANVKFISSTLSADASASATAFDVVAAFKSSGLQIAAGAFNLGSGLDYGYGSYSLPSLARLDAAYTLPFGLSLNAEGAYLFSGGVMGGAGLSYDILGYADVRAGYHFGNEKAIPSYASVGAGVHVFGLKLDFTYLLASENIGGTLMFGLGYTF